MPLHLACKILLFLLNHRFPRGASMRISTKTILWKYTSIFLGRKLWLLYPIIRSSLLFDIREPLVILGFYLIYKVWIYEVVEEGKWPHATCLHRFYWLRARDTSNGSPQHVVRLFISETVWQSTTPPTPASLPTCLHPIK